MHTTIALQPPTHDRLLEYKRRHRLRSMDAVIRSLLDGPVLSATALFAQHEAQVRSLCLAYGVKRLVAFGSRVRGTARPDSDLDLVADLPPSVGLFEVANLTGGLEEILGVRVQLATFGPHLGRLLPVIKKEGVVLIG